MKQYLNKENVTALVVVILGVLIAGFIGPTVASWIGKAKSKVSGS